MDVALDRTRVLVGPVIGGLFGGGVSILLEIDRSKTLEAILISRNGVEQTVVVHLSKRKPGTFTFSGLIPGCRFVFSVPELGVRCDFRTPQSAHAPWYALSCNKRRHLEELISDGKQTLWDHLADRMEDLGQAAPAGVIHMGDQVYADSDFYTGDTSSPSGRWLTKASEEYPDSPEDQARFIVSHHDEVLEEFQNEYRALWNIKGVARTLASTFNYMIPDDHECVDDLGDGDGDVFDSPSAFPTTGRQAIIKIGAESINLYQRQLSHGGMVDASSVAGKYYFSIESAVTNTRVLVLDTRLARTFSQGAEGELYDAQINGGWRNPMAMLGAEQTEWLMKQFRAATERNLVIVSPIPPVLLSRPLNRLGSHIVNDLLGLWAADKFGDDLDRLMNLLAGWKLALPYSRRVFILSGDSHMMGETVLHHRETGEVIARQFVSSPISNDVPSKLSTALAKAATELSETSGSFGCLSFEHKSWEGGLNFGVLHPNASVPHKAFRWVMMAPHHASDQSSCCVAV